MFIVQLFVDCLVIDRVGDNSKLCLIVRFVTFFIYYLDFYFCFSFYVSSLALGMCLYNHWVCTHSFTICVLYTDHVLKLGQTGSVLITNHVFGISLFFFSVLLF